MGTPFVFVFEVAFLEDPSETKIQNHSHEIRLEKLVWTLLTRYHFAITRYQNIEKLLEMTNIGPIWPGHRPAFTRIPYHHAGFSFLHKTKLGAKGPLLTSSCALSSDN